MAEHIEPQQTSVDQKLEATDSKQLGDLQKAFEESFPRDEPAPAKPEPKGPKEPAAKAPGKPQERAETRSGHHAPVEVAEPDVETAKAEGEGELNLLGFREIKPGARKRKTEAPPLEAEPESEPATKEDKEAPEAAKEEEADPEVDAVRVKENAHPAVKDGIQRLKTIAHNRRNENRDLIRRNQTLAQELDGLKKNGVSPEMAAELTRLRATSQRFDLLNDPGFRAKYEDPIQQKGDQLCDYVVQITGGSEGMKAWAEGTKKFGYANIQPGYWDDEVINKIPSETERQRVARMAAELTYLSDERNRMVNDFVSNPDKVTEYQQAKSLEFWTNYQKEAQAESDLMVSQIGEWAKIKDLAQAKSDEEKAEWSEHNERCEGYKTLFEKTMGDIVNGGARKHVRIAAMAIYGMDLDRRLKLAEADCKDYEAENRQLKSQIAKLSRTRSIPGTRGGGVETKPETGVKTGDARKALNDYFGNLGR